MKQVLTVQRSFIVFFYITDGLKDNPLYVTSGDVSNAEEGPVYGVVNKSKQIKKNVASDDKKKLGPVHAEMQKSSKHGSVFGHLICL